MPALTFPLIYIAGPYTQGGEVPNTRRAIEIADQILDGDYAIPLVPHLSMVWDLVAPKPYDRWLAYDLQLLKRCDAIYRLTGDSEGADTEVEYARSLEMPIFFENQGGIGVLEHWAIKWANPMNHQTEGLAVAFQAIALVRNLDDLRHEAIAMMYDAVTEADQHTLAYAIIGLASMVVSLAHTDIDDPETYLNTLGPTIVGTIGHEL